MIKRNTTISRHVIKILEESNQAVTVLQILKTLNDQNLYPNKTTIYRLMDKLVSDGMIKVIIGKNGTSYYERSDHDHHHFFCHSCEQVFCLPPSKDINIDSLIQNQEFKVTGHDFNIYGICEPCSNN